MGVIIELTTKDAERFKLFREYQEDIDTLVKSGFFNFKGGKALVHRDRKGKIQKVEITRISFFLKIR